MTVPEVDENLWQEMDVIARWLVASRAAVLLMTLSSSLLGGLLAWRDGVFDAYLWGLTTLGLLLAHATNNLLNDYVDSFRGIDKDNYFRNRYGVQTLESGLLSKVKMLRYIVVTGAVALAIGGVLVYERGSITIVLMSAGAFFALFYTYPLKTIGLGEPAVLLVWGPLMVGGSYFVVSGHWHWPVAGFSLVYALGPTAVLFGKHIDKLADDRRKKVRSLPVLLGRQLACRSVVVMLSLQYVLVVVVVAVGWISPSLLITFLNLANFRKTCSVFIGHRPDERPYNFPAEIWPLWFSPYAFDHTRKFSGLLIVGLILDVNFF